MLPKRILIVRHGESVGNTDKSHYAVTPDWSVELTEKGRNQARLCGLELSLMVKEESIGIFHSPWTRAVQTTSLISDSLINRNIRFLIEDVRLQEQNYGGRLADVETHLIDKIEADRDAYGKFWYRLLNGENFSDVYNRVANFWIDKKLEWHEQGFQEVSTLIIVCHGATSRMLYGYLKKLTVQQMTDMKNPENCGILELKYNVGSGCYE